MTSRRFSALLAMLIVLLGGCSTLVPAPSVPAVAPAAAHAAWARVLAERDSPIHEGAQ